MKFRHKDNFNELYLEQVLYIIITKYHTDNGINSGNLSKLLAGILLKEDVELLLEGFDYVKVTETN